MLDAFGRGGSTQRKSARAATPCAQVWNITFPSPALSARKWASPLTATSPCAIRSGPFSAGIIHMVRDVLDGLIEGAPGNASIARMEGRTPGLLLEALFVAESTRSTLIGAPTASFPPRPCAVVDLQGAAVQMGIYPIGCSPSTAPSGPHSICPWRTAQRAGASGATNSRRPSSCHSRRGTRPHARGAAAAGRAPRRTGAQPPSRRRIRAGRLSQSSPLYPKACAAPACAWTPCGGFSSRAFSLLVRLRRNILT